MPTEWPTQAIPSIHANLVTPKPATAHGIDATTAVLNPTAGAGPAQPDTLEAATFVLDAVASRSDSERKASVSSLFTQFSILCDREAVLLSTPAGSIVHLTAFSFQAAYASVVVTCDVIEWDRSYWYSAGSSAPVVMPFIGAMDNENNSNNPPQPLLSSSSAPIVPSKTTSLRLRHSTIAAQAVRSSFFCLVHCLLCPLFLQRAAKLVPMLLFSAGASCSIM